jgi:hypothetical protein
VFSSGADRYSMKESREAGVQFPLTIPDEGEILRASGLVICRKIKRESKMAIRRGFVHPTPRK